MREFLSANADFVLQKEGGLGRLELGGLHSAMLREYAASDLGRNLSCVVVLWG